jgi:transcriptional regulator with XRE-family HTH domain
METLNKVIERARDRHVPLPPPKVRRALRIARDLTQDDTAELMEVARATVSRWETGQREPRGELRRKYAELLRELREGV